METKVSLNCAIGSSCDAHDEFAKLFTASNWIMSHIDSHTARRETNQSRLGLHSPCDLFSPSASRGRTKTCSLLSLSLAFFPTPDNSSRMTIISVFASRRRRDYRASHRKYVKSCFSFSSAEALPAFCPPHASRKASPVRRSPCELCISRHDRVFLSRSSDKQCAANPAVHCQLRVSPRWTRTTV